MSRLTDPVQIGSHESPSRVMLGPHETNLGRGRSISDRHVAYYVRRAAGGAGVIVTEIASVHPSDWPYERAPLASSCGEGWKTLVKACAPYGTVLLAGIGHAGGEGSSAWSQSVLWAPSRVPDAASREMPAEMQLDEIAQVVDGFGAAGGLAIACGLAGVELDAGPRSLLRQFHSGLTNHRDDRYGADRLALTREAIRATRRAMGPGGLLGLRLSCDELAPWAGVTPDLALEQVRELADDVDMITIVRGGPYSVDAYRPRAHGGQGFNVDLACQMRDAAGGRVVIAVQGSLVEVAMAEQVLAQEKADLVEMTRAQIAEPRLVELVRAGTPERVRPCVLCNQACCVRDARNPLVSCIGEPSSGYETDEAAVEGLPAGTGSPGSAKVLVAGGGPAGLECARVAAERGFEVHLVEASDRLGGALTRAAVGPGQERLSLLTSWLAAECARLGVRLELSCSLAPEDLDRALAEGVAVVLATGSRPNLERLWALGLGNRKGNRKDDGSGSVQPDPEGVPIGIDGLAVLDGGLGILPEGPLVVDDPIGGPIGVAMAEWLAAGGKTVAIVTQDPVAGNGLSRTGDLSAANGRLARAGVRRELRCRIVGVGSGEVVLEDVLTGERRQLPCVAVVDCGHRLADDRLWSTRSNLVRAGDCVAPRTALEAILEGRRRAVGLARANHEPPAPARMHEVAR